MKEIFIQGIEAMAPGVFSERKMSQIERHVYQFGQLIIPTDSPNYPSRSDEKIMRQDVKASILMINELVSKSDLVGHTKDIPLFVANGAFVEDTNKHLSRIIDVYKTIEVNDPEEDKIRKIYRASPPLVALETLTNSSMSFIAQYTGIKSHNATFGNTSISAYYALQEAAINLDSSAHILVNSSNCAGDYSFLSNMSVLSYSPNWKESAGVACLLLGRKQEANKASLARITYLNNSKDIPDLEGTGIQRNWSTILLDDKADCLIHSGAYTDEVNQEDNAYCSGINKNSFSWFSQYGNLGPSNVFFGIMKATEFLRNGHAIVDVLDRDVYGRESVIRVERC